MCCSETGYCFHMDIYGRKNEEEQLVSGVGASVIMKMAFFLQYPGEYEIFFDNFFTSFELLMKLKERNIKATGTVRYNRMNKCPLKPDNTMKKEQRGAYDYRYDEKNDIFAFGLE